MAKFRIQSVQTEFYVTSNGTETNGSVVETVPKSQYNPSITVLEIVPPVIAPAPVIATVRGGADLFVGYKDVGGTLFLSWTDAPVKWVISPTGTDFNIRPADGQDLYWFDKFNVGIFRR
ncbi:hypothetical protein AX14_011224, partial [Amanita brunnescens Koide BX004]